MKKLARVAVGGALVISVAVPTSVANGGATSLWANCTAVHARYPHGVGRAGAHDHTRTGRNPVTNFYRSTRLYNTAMRVNSDLDRDRDGVACEAH
jgi:hypothetical protein